MRKKQVVLIGDSMAGEDKLKTAYEIGKFVAENGWVLITGGRGGVMDSASRGAKECGGLVVAILPSSSFYESTPYADVVIPTGIGFARNYVNVLSGDVVVAVGGGSGTLSEIAYAWQFGKPIIACAFVDGWSKKLAGTKIDEKRNDKILEAKNIEDVKNFLLHLLNA